MVSAALAGNPFQYPIFQAIDADGNPVSGGWVYTYEAGTTTPKVAYSDAGLSVPIENPIELDSKGERLFFVAGSCKINVKTSAGVQVDGFPVDNLLSGTNLAFNNLTAVRASDSTPSYITLLGYSSAGDGGGGLYYWDSTSVLTDNGGAIVKLTSTVTGRYVRMYEPPVNIMWFGAKGDVNTVEDTSFIEAADAWALSTGEGIYIPGGHTFYVDEVEFNVNVSGFGTVKKLPSVAGGGSTVYIELPNLIIKDITVDGNLEHNGINTRTAAHKCTFDGIKVQNTLGSGLAIRGADDCRVTNSTFTTLTGQFGDGVYCQDSERVIVSNNVIYDFIRDGIVFETGSADCTAEFNDIRYGHDTTDGFNAGVWCELGTSVKIIGNTIVGMEGVAAYTGRGIVTATDYTASEFPISGNLIDDCPVGMALGGSNLKTTHIVTGNTITDYSIGVLCTSGLNFNISNNHFGSATFATVDEACILYDNSIANGPNSLILNGNTKETNTYTDTNSADIRFKTSFVRIADVSIVNMLGSWRVNSSVDGIEQLYISNSDLSFSASTPATYTFPAARTSLLMTGTTITLLTPMILGDNLVIGNISSCNFAGNEALTLGDAGTATIFRFSGVSVASNISILAAYSATGEEYWDGLFTVRKVIDCTVAATFKSVFAVGGGATLSFTPVRSQIRVDDAMAGVTGQYLGLSLGTLIQYGATSTAAAGGVFAQNTKGAWTSWPGSACEEVTAADTIYLEAVLTNVDGNGAAGGGNFGGAAGDAVTVIVQGHRQEVLPDL